MEFPLHKPYPYSLYRFLYLYSRYLKLLMIMLSFFVTPSNSPSCKASAIAKEPLGKSSIHCKPIEFSYSFWVILLIAEILHQFICRFSYYLQGFIHVRWCRISFINSRNDELSYDIICVVLFLTVLFFSGGCCC